MAKGIRPNVSGGAGGERWDRRAAVKVMASRARRAEDDAMIAEGVDEYGTDWRYEEFGSHENRGGSC